MNKSVSYERKKKERKLMIRKYENKEKHFKVIIIRIRINKSNSTKTNYKLRNPHQILQMVGNGD